MNQIHSQEKKYYDSLLLIFLTGSKNEISSEDTNLPEGVVLASPPKSKNNGSLAECVFR